MKKNLINVVFPVTMLVCMVLIGMVLKAENHRRGVTICKCPCTQQFTDLIDYFRGRSKTPQAARHCIGQPVLKTQRAASNQTGLSLGELLPLDEEEPVINGEGSE